MYELKCNHNHENKSDLEVM